MSRRSGRVDAEGDVDPLLVDHGRTGDGGAVAASLLVALLVSSPATIGALRGVTSPGTALTAFVASLAVVWALAAAWACAADGLGRLGATRGAPRPADGGRASAAPGAGGADADAGRVDPC